MKTRRFDAFPNATVISVLLALGACSGSSPEPLATGRLSPAVSDDTVEVFENQQAPADFP